MRWKEGINQISRKQKGKSTRGYLTKLYANNCPGSCHQTQTFQKPLLTMAWHSFCSVRERGWMICMYGAIMKTANSAKVNLREIWLWLFQQQFSGKSRAKAPFSVRVTLKSLISSGRHSNSNFSPFIDSRSENDETIAEKCLAVPIFGHQIWRNDDVVTSLSRIFKRNSMLKTSSTIRH